MNVLGSRTTRRQGGRKNAGALRALGLGIITGAADDDPTAIGTYASAGAKFGGTHRADRAPLTALGPHAWRIAAMQNCAVGMRKIRY